MARDGLKPLKTAVFRIFSERLRVAFFLKNVKRVRVETGLATQKGLCYDIATKKSAESAWYSDCRASSSRRFAWPSRSGGFLILKNYDLRDKFFVHKLMATADTFRL